MSTTALGVITAAFQELNCFLPSESIPSADANSALGYLNRMMSSWRQQSLTIPSVAREVFTLTANKGGPSNPYTIGTGGDLNTQKPPSQSNITGAGLNLNSSSPVVEIPRAVLTDDAWANVRVKELTSTLFTSVYYNPTFSTGLGTVNLWPVPTTSDNSLVLYLQKALIDFADLSTTTYTFPDGYEDALVYNLARRIAKPFGAPLEGDLLDKAVSSLRVIKRSNLKLCDLANDFAGDRQARYNIVSGTGG